MKSYNTIKEIIAIVEKVKNEKTLSHKNSTEMNRLQKNVDISFLEKKSAIKKYQYMLNAFNKGEFEKAFKHSQKLAIQVKPVANDTPFELGEKIAVIRYEHGWLDGRLEAVVTKRTQNSKGIWSYVAKVTSEENVNYDENNSYEIEINHTRDAVSCY